MARTSVKTERKRWDLNQQSWWETLWLKIRQKKTPSQLPRNKGTHRILLDEVNLAMKWKTDSSGKSDKKKSHGREWESRKNVAFLQGWMGSSNSTKCCWYRNGETEIKMETWKSSVFPEIFWSSSSRQSRMN